MTDRYHGTLHPIHIVTPHFGVGEKARRIWYVEQMLNASFKAKK